MCAWVNGENQGTSSIGRSLARHKMKHPAPEEHGGGGAEGGKEMTISEKPGGGFHSHSKMNAMDTEGKHAEHPTIEHAVQAMHQHFGHGGEKKEHEPKAEGEPGGSAETTQMGGGGGLEDMGVTGA